MCLKHKLIFVTGVPGVGKSHLIHHDKKLSKLIHIDIRLVYELYPEASEMGGWTLAQDKLIEMALMNMATYNKDVVCEAILLAGTPSRERLEGILRQRKLKHRFIDLKGNYDECLSRVTADYIGNPNPDTESKDWVYFRKRVDILRSYHDKGLI